jgi:hypothetical protein
VTHGKLNEKKSNAILMTSSIGGNHHLNDFLIGPGKALDATSPAKPAEVDFMNAKITDFLNRVTGNGRTLQ